MTSPPRPVTRPSLAPQRTTARRLRLDRASTWAVRGGGLAIVVSILGIFAFILVEVWPLLGTAHVTAGPTMALAGAAPRALLGNEHRTHIATLDADGTLRVTRLADATVVHSSQIGPSARAGGVAPALVTIASPPGSDFVAASTTDGRIVVVPIAWSVTFAGDRRTVVPDVRPPIVLEVDPAGREIRTFAVQLDGDGVGTAVAQLADGSLAVVSRTVRENMMTGAITESLERGGADGRVRFDALVLDRARQWLFGATDGGALHWWRVKGTTLEGPQVASAEAIPVTALALLLGERALVVGQENGALSVWFPVRRPDERFELVRIREFPPHAAPVRLIYPSARDRGFLTVDAAGEVRLHHSTSNRTLWTGHTTIEAPTALFYSPKADAAYLAGDGTVATLAIANPHPEASLATLFGRIWYEGYGAPEYAWQSSGSTDDFEPKFSLMPLLVGTLKGTVYSLALAIPLAVFGAMYASQFMHPRFRNVVKPTVEIMAALPSVVLGFLAGLWLAPRLEQALPALVLMTVALPAVIIATGFAWQRLPAVFRRRFATGTEAFVFVGALAVGMALCFAVGPWFETWAFGGSFQEWLLGHAGITYDQRNAIIVGLAMGFAVIPIIFSVSEDAFASVPMSLISGSLALGATRWQTVTRVVLPTASPGIFSAVMIGFGRAVGETMIVLMATGNTPIIDWSPFNGFRTLSANIAVEIPEAPEGGTLYRVLFLAALLLFMITFAVNTIAELVRQRLRRRYGQL